MRKENRQFSDNIGAYLQRVFGGEAVRLYQEIALLPMPQYVRLNTFRESAPAVPGNLNQKYGISLQPVPGFPEAWLVDDPGNLSGKTIEHVLGLYYIQSLSSMLPPLALQPKPGSTVLDLCAAPGSKTTQLAALMQNTGVLVANEIQLDRVKSLSFNLERMGVVNCGISHANGELLGKRAGDTFDSILIDAPCSGLGILQKKGEVNNWWSEAHIAKLADIQYRLLVSAARLLKTGGELVYSTCTLTLEENEQVVNRFLAKYPFEAVPLTLPVAAAPAFSEANGERFAPGMEFGARLLPWVNESEGFFLIKLRKTGEVERLGEQPEFRPSRESHDVRVDFSNGIAFLEGEFGIPRSVLQQYEYLERGGEIFAVAAGWAAPEGLHLNKAGLKMGTFDKYGNFILSSLGAQLFGSSICRNVAVLETPEALKAYFEGGSARGDFGIRGQKAVIWNGYMLGTGVYAEGKLKSRFPRAFRTQKIVYA